MACHGGHLRGGLGGWGDERGGGLAEHTTIASPAAATKKRTGYLGRLTALTSEVVLACVGIQKKSEREKGLASPSSIPGPRRACH